MSRDGRSVKSEERAADREREEKAAEREERVKAADREEKESEREKRARAAEHDLELRRMEYEFTKLEMTRADPQRQVGTDRGSTKKWQGGPPRQDTLAGRIKIFGDAMRHVLPQMPSESPEMPQFFETVEKLFAMYDVPNDIKSKLLITVLTAQAKALVNRMSVECVGQYSELKSFLLAEYKLTPREYKVRFDTTTKNVNETYLLFATRLRNLLSYYLARKSVGGDFDKLCDLMIADRLKGSLSHGSLNYILSLEEWTGTTGLPMIE